MTFTNMPDLLGEEEAGYAAGICPNLRADLFLECANHPIHNVVAMHGLSDELGAS